MSSINPAANWPLLLCGPILRRVEKNSVSVFVVLKHRCRVKLSIYAGNSTEDPLLVQQEEESIPLGRFLNAKVIMAPLATRLEPGETYGYNLSFTRLDDAGTGVEDLDSLGLLDGRSAMLGYERDKLPTFALPPDNISDLSKLRIVHASCRLPPAQAEDALATLDKIIEQSHADPLNRPHQLFLTGDQIYADDVEDSMLWLAGKVGAALLSWPGLERLPGIKDNDTVSTTIFDLAPGNRMPLLHQKAKLTSDSAQSHLVTLAEYYGMYLLVWSDVAWFPDELPGPDVVFEHEDWENNQDKLEAALEHFNKRHNLALEFIRLVAKVRRALANVPTYMICDDHEVTDDWYLHKQWFEDVRGNELGKRVLQNGLSAFAVFQAWGNDPDKFANNLPGGELLSALADWKGGEDDNSVRTARKICSLLDLPSADAGMGRVEWNYYLDCSSYQVFVIDSRTHRDFPAGDEEKDKRKAPGLMTPAEIQRQITNKIEENRAQNRVFAFTLLVSPAPVIGHPFLEESLQPAFVFIWDIFRPEGATKFDFEAWSFNPSTFEAFLRSLVPLGQVLILSGDVHYGFTVSVDYWDQFEVTGGDRRKEKRARFIQCTSSGLKNEGRLNLLLASKITVAAAKNQSFLGWETPGYHLALDGRKHLVPGTPALKKVPAAVNSYLEQPKWRYRVTFHSDQRTDDERGTPISPPSTPLDSGLKKYAALAGHHAERFLFGMRVVVGHNNLAEITLDWSATNPKIKQTLWFNFAESPDAVSRPYTAHEVSFKVLGVLDQEPDLGQR